MIHGYDLVSRMCRELSDFMESHGFNTIDEFRGHSLQYLTTHAELVRRQDAARRKKTGGTMVSGDHAWEAARFVRQSRDLVANE